MDTNFNQGPNPSSGGSAAVPAPQAGQQPLPNQHLIGGPDDPSRQLLKPNATVQKVLFTRLESLDHDEVMQLASIVTPDTIGVLNQVFPELIPMIQKAGQFNQGSQDTNDQTQQTLAGTPGADTDTGDQNQSLPDKMLSMSGNGQDQQGMAKGGIVGALHGHTAVADKLNRTGYANKGIPTDSLSRGGMVGLPRIASAPHASSLTSRVPALERVNSRKYNSPGMAAGGVVQADQGTGNGFAAGGLMQDPEQMQAQQNQQVAQQTVPAESTADNIPIKASKGEFVMDAPTVMFYGTDKLMKMQANAHAKLAEHVSQQQASQDQNQQQPPAQQQIQQNQQAAQQQSKQPLVAPPSGPQPDATQQRIAQDDTPKPQASPFSLIG